MACAPQTSQTCLLFYHIFQHTEDEKNKLYLQKGAVGRNLSGQVKLTRIIWWNKAKKASASFNHPIRTTFKPSRQVGRWWQSHFLHDSITPGWHSYDKAVAWVTHMTCRLDDERNLRFNPIVSGDSMSNVSNDTAWRAHGHQIERIWYHRRQRHDGTMVANGSLKINGCHINVESVYNLHFVLK